MSIRTFVLLAYGLFLAAGTVALILWQQPPAMSGFKATRALNAGEFVLPGDLVADAVPVGYATRSIDAGQAVGPDDLNTLPPLTSVKGLIPVAFSVARAHVVAGTINAGKSVQLCADKTPAASLPRASVRMVLCADRATQCIAILDIPSSKDDVLKASDTLIIKPALVANAKPCE